MQTICLNHADHVFIPDLVVVGVVSICDLHGFNL